MEAKSREKIKSSKKVLRSICLENFQKIKSQPKLKAIKDTANNTQIPKLTLV